MRVTADGATASGDLTGLPFPKDLRHQHCRTDTFAIQEQEGHRKVIATFPMARCLGMRVPSSP